MTGVLTDGQWAVVASLIEACRPHRKTQHHDLRRTIEVTLAFTMTVKSTIVGGSMSLHLCGCA